MATPDFSKMNNYDIQVVRDDTVKVISEVDSGSTEYTVEQHQEAQDTQRALASYLADVERIKVEFANKSDSQLMGIIR